MPDHVLSERQFHAVCINRKWNCETVPCQSKTGQDGRIPLILAQEAYKEYAAEYGESQNFARLHERGGFGIDELAILLFNRIKRLEREKELVALTTPRVEGD